MSKHLRDLTRLYARQLRELRRTEAALKRAEQAMMRGRKRR